MSVPDVRLRVDKHLVWHEMKSWGGMCSHVSHSSGYTEAHHRQLVLHHRVSRCQAACLLFCAQTPAAWLWHSTPNLVVVCEAIEGRVLVQHAHLVVVREGVEGRVLVERAAGGGGEVREGGEVAVALAHEGHVDAHLRDANHQTQQPSR